MIEITSIILSLISFSAIGEILLKSYLTTNNFSKYFLLIWCTILVLVAGFREGTADYVSYVNLFTWAPNLIDVIINNDWAFFIFTREEIGYLLINSLVKIFTNESSILFLVIAIISISLYYKNIRKYSVYPLISLMLYFSLVYCVKELAQIRQGVAIAIFVYSWKYIIQNNFKKYFISLWIASLFHLSIWIMIFIYPLRKVKINTFNIIIFFAYYRDDFFF